MQIKGEIADIPTQLSYFKCGGGNKLYLTPESTLHCSIYCVGVKSATGDDLSRNELNNKIACNPSFFSLELWDSSTKSSIQKGNPEIGTIQGEALPDKDGSLRFHITSGTNPGERYYPKIYLNHKGLDQTISKVPIQGSNGLLIINKRNSEDEEDDFTKEIIILVVVLVAGIVFFRFAYS